MGHGGDAGDVAGEHHLKRNNRSWSPTSGPTAKAEVAASPREVVFLCLVGSTPAVLTESVWALAVRNPLLVPDRIIAVTTTSGRKHLVRQLFDEGHWGGMLEALRRKYPKIRGKLNFGPIPECLRCITNVERTRELDDVRTREDNLAVAEFLMELVRGITENADTRLIVSLAGGRKTTGALLHSVMTLLGRQDDLLTHVLVSEPWMTLPGFVYPGCPGAFRDPSTGRKLDSRSAQIELAEVPFVPLRYLFAKELHRTAGGFARLMAEVRGRAVGGGALFRVRITPANGTLHINDREVVLGPNPFLVYLFFCVRARDGREAASSYKEVGDELPGVHAAHAQAHPVARWTKAALRSHLDPSEDIRKWVGEIRVALRRAKFDSGSIDWLAPTRRRLGLGVPAAQIEIAGG